MQFTDFSQLDLNRLPSPCFVVDEVAVERNLRILREVADASGASPARTGGGPPASATPARRSLARRDLALRTV